jgi:hypothetical protein
MEKLFSLLELQRRIFEAPTRDAVLHLILNDTKRILPYVSGVFFNYNTLLLKPEKISGNIIFDPQSDFITRRLGVIKDLKSQNQNVVLYEQDSIHAAILYLTTYQEAHIGVLWFEFDRPVHEAEKVILDEMAVVFSQALALWQRRKANSFPTWALSSQRKKIIIAFGLVIFFLPVKLNISAPAEIVARDAHIITAPFDGVVEDIKFDSGSLVKEGDIVAIMEQDGLVAQAELADQSLRVAQSSLSRLQRESLRDSQKRQQMMELQDTVRSKKIERDYAQSLQKRSMIITDQAGTLIIDDEQGLRGKPVKTGDRLMMIANPDDYELLIRVPINNMTPLEVGSSVKFFLNVNPLSGQAAKITRIGYQASPDADGLLTYKVTAEIDKKASQIRIGWTGTARIQGGWSFLGYAVLRRPLITLRNITGL